MKNKKILYISNVNLNGPFLAGVIHKIKGQEKAFKKCGYEIDILYPEVNNIISIEKNNGKKYLFNGGQDTYKEGSIITKIYQHYQIFQHGSIDFSDCLNSIIEADYDVIYLRFFLPGKDLIAFLEKIRMSKPHILILLEYPTLNIKNIFKSSFSRRIGHLMNLKKIKRLNQLSDYIITLTKDKTLFGKPAIFMANGITVDDIKPVSVPIFTNKLILLGVASDCAIYHGFDKVIKGLSFYKKQMQEIVVTFRIISNPLSKNVDVLKKLVKELDVVDLVTFENSKTRNELAEDYQRVHLGMGTLALHRINLLSNFSLKHLEYAAFGLPFIMSKGDIHFEDSPYVYVVERDEEPLDINQVVNFYQTLRKNHSSYPLEFRKSIETKITWEAQMKNVFEIINKV